MGRIFSIIIWVFALGTVDAGGSMHAQDAPIEGENAELDRLIFTLENEAARNRLINELQQLRKVAEPDSDGDPVNQVVDYLKDKQTAFDDLLLDVVESWNRIPEFIQWMRSEISNPMRRDVWLEVALRISVVFFSGWLVNLLVKQLWREPPPGPTLALSIKRFARELVLAATFALTAIIILYALHQPLLTRIVARDLVLAVVTVTIWRSLLRDLIGPFLPEYLGEKPVAGLINGIIRTGTLALAGYFILNAALRLGLPWSFHAFGNHILFLMIAVSLIAMVIRVRDPVAARIRALRKDNPTLITRLLPVGYIAAMWHWVIIGLILAHYVTWALAIHGGLWFLARATFSSIVILVIGRLLILYNDRLFEQGETAAEADEEVLQDVQERASRYANPIRILVRWVIAIAVLLSLSWVWQTGLIEWLRSANGYIFTTMLLRLGTLALVTVLISEGVSLAVARFINATDMAGRPKRSNRSKTLASILKNVAIALIVAIAIMLALSEIGVDAAALLAGAGVIGLAIGFGSQRLVQDLINGLFILLGDTVRVGDVVEVGGKAGTVESMSMRTVSLRAYDGNVHTVPYSSIDTITNMTKDYSFAVIEVGVSYGSDLEMVLKELQSLDQQIRREWPYRRLILAPIEIAGVDALSDSAVLIKARMKTRAGEQWTVRREMTKRIKHRFDEVGIEIPFPHRTLLITHDKKEAVMPLQDAPGGQNMAARS